MQGNASVGSPWARWLANPWATPVLVALALLLVSPCLTVGFAADDHMLRIRAPAGPPILGFSTGPWDLFSFITGDPGQARELEESGILPWWAVPGFRLGFFRPLSSLTHALDFALWPDQPVAMYLHSMAWFAVALVALGGLYRRFHTGPIAALALLLFALDDARGPVVGYISNRNALLMLCFGVAVLWAHDRWRRDGWAPGAWLGPLALAAGMLAGEGTLGVVGYLLGHALFVDRSPPSHRVRALAPYGAVLLLWGVVYKIGGYGTFGSDLYLDPGAEPGPFLVAAGTRIPLLLAAQFAGPWADLEAAYSPAVRLGVLVWALGAGAVLATLLWRRFAADPVARMWATGCLVATVPIASTFPADRLLGFVGVGAMGLVAMFLADWRRDPNPSRMTTLVAWSLVVLHLVLAPLLLPVRARSMVTVAESLAMFDVAVPTEPSIAARHVIAVVTPADGLMSYLPITRAAQGAPGPRSVRGLVSTTGAVTVTRTDLRTLEIDADVGLLSGPGQRMTRSIRRPFALGERFDLGHRDRVATAEVLELTDDGRPKRVRFRFARVLESPEHLWLRWADEGFVPWLPVAVGGSERLPGFDLLRTLEVVGERGATER